MSLPTTTQPPSVHHDDAEPGLERGSFAPPGVETSPSKLVVVTYNIRYAVGSFLITGSLLRRLGLGRPQRRARLVEKNILTAARAFTDGARLPHPDLIALQEADRRTLRAGLRHVSRELAEALGMSYVHASTPTPTDEEPKAKQWWLDFEEHMRRGEEGDTGVALLSRLPLSEAARVELPWSDCAWRPRLALTATLPFAGRRLRVFNAHIDPHAGLEEQLAQHRAVLALADQTSDGEPTVILGDFNTLSRTACEAARTLLEAHGYTTPLPTGTGTWRAGLLRLHPDWIFTRGVRVTRWGVARGLGVSDHWPVWAEIEPEGKV